MPTSPHSTSCPNHASDSMCPPLFPKEIVPRLQADKQHRTPLRTFPLNLRPSWQPNKFLPSRGMEGRLETELSTVGILETPSEGKRKQKESHLNVSPMELGSGGMPGRDGRQQPRSLSPPPSLSSGTNSPSVKQCCPDHLLRATGLPRGFCRK